MEGKSFFEKGYVQALLTLILVGAVLSLGAYAHLTLKEARGVYLGDASISVSGTGEVLAKPDVGNFSFAVKAEEETASEAQEKSAEAINGILGFLKESGVEEKDIKTQYYNLNPNYRYEERVCAFNTYCPPGERVIDGYVVSQNVSIKVHDLESAGDLISGVGERGATNISSLNFTIDDETVLQAEARAKAIAEAKEKAGQLAEDLGMKIVRIISFSEGGAGNYYKYESRAMAMDGAVEDSISPQLPVGENTITSNVNITFELR